jgi:ATP phosphoribosyltransferase regulatory subunit
MSKPFVFEKPLGMRDVLPQIVEKKIDILGRIQQVLKKWGYQQIETPTLEFYDTVGGVSSTMEQRLFKLLDRSGHSLVMRPDMTAPIARVVGSLLKEQPFPLRLSYQGNVFRAQENEAGRNAEFPEVGIELVGEEAPDADAEVITLAIASLQAAEVKQFKLSIGHVGFMNAIFNESLDNEDQEKKLRQFLYLKDYVGYRHFVDKTSLEDNQKRRLLSLLELCGGQEQIGKAKQWAIGEKSAQAVRELEELWTVLEIHGVTEHVSIDFSLIREDRDYYTGILFEGYADQLGFPIFNGGRYDHLLGQFGRPAPAIGFALKVDRILEASQLEVRNSERKVLITYTEKERKKAFTLAKTLRDDKCIVILHRLNNDQETALILENDFDQQIRLEQGGGIGWE